MKCTFLMLFIFVMISVVSTKSRRRTNLPPQKIEQWFKDGKYKKIGKALRIHPDLIKPGAKNPVNETDILKYSFEQVDILLTPEQKKQRENQNYSMGFGERWPFKEIPFYILNISFNSSDDLDTVIKGVQIFNDGQNMFVFRPWIATDHDCVMIYYGNRAYSNLGHVGGLQSISVSQDDIIIALRVVHFIFHTMGFVHETDRPDRDKYIHVRYDTIPEGLHPALYTVNPNTYDNITLLPWDINSLIQLPPKYRGVRIYDINDKSVDENEIGVYHKWTDLDKRKLANFYEM